MAEITLDDLFACDEQGTLLVAEDRASGKAVHISDARNGKNCDCICPCCRRDLIARQGSIQHSFAHAPQDIRSSCASAGETLLHRFAKELLSKHRYIVRPKVVVADELGPLVVALAQRVDFEKVELEVHQGDVVPDVVCYLGDARLYIEFKVTHAVDDRKRRKLRSHDASVMEIDLSSYRSRPLTELETVILESAPRTMIQSKLLERGDLKLADRQAKKRDALRRDAQGLVSLWRRPADPAPVESAWYQECLKYGLDKLEKPRPVGRTAFNIDGRSWRLWLLWSMCFKKASGSAGLWAMRLKDMKWVKHEDLVRGKPEFLSMIRAEIDKDFQTAVEEIDGYLEELVERGCLVDNQQVGYHIANPFRLRLEEEVARVDLPINRWKRIEADVAQLLRYVPDQGQNEFVLDDWLERYCLEQGLTIAGLLTGPDGPFDLLTAGLAKLRTCVVTNRIPEAHELMALPLVDFFDRRDRENKIRAEQARLAAELEGRQRGVERAQEVERNALSWMRPQAFAWLERDVQIEGITDKPAAHAERSPAAYAEVIDLLRAEAEVWRNHEQFERARSLWLGRLRDAVRKVYATEALVDAWMNSSHRDLGLKRPSEVCVDENTFNRCVAILPAGKQRRTK